MIRLVVIGLMGVVGMVGCGGGDDQGRDASIGGAGGGGGAGLGGSGGSGGSAECFDMIVLAGELGGECRTVGGVPTECNGDLVCLGEDFFTIGGPNDPILNYPPGENESFDIPVLPGDYCTLGLTASPAECTVEDDAACAEVCGACTPFFIDADICLRQCRAETDTNSTCRDGYVCDLLFEVCDTGCVSDDDCRVFREDSNDNGMFDPWDPETMMGDRLVYDTNSTFVCNTATYRCEHPGTPGAEAGIACDDDQQCEANGTCLDEALFGFPGGYCSKIRCDLDGNDCAGAGVCAGLGFGVPLCAESCQVGSGATPGDPNTYLNNTQGCREGYTCFWGGVPNDTTGVCVPGVYNDVITNNVGADCMTNDTCYSPFGQGVCADAELACSFLGAPAGEACPAGFGCSVLDCGVPGIPNDVCGDNATCVGLPSGLSLCLQDCESAEDCLAGSACIDLDEDPLSICFPLCLDDDLECRSGEVCDTGACVLAP
ncbi:MAG: hypothetical protein OEM15_17760 [Myxococcales bacterium]|nr:hypothetical protein [Myxococcales bacterium]MDH3485593.1 hypothetical protein [Myxococcales bacterium]